MLTLGLNTFVFLIGMIVLLSTSGRVYRRYAAVMLVEGDSDQNPDILRSIGKWENVLIFCLAWQGYYEAIALFFIGKMIMVYRPQTPLSLISAGSLINYAYSILIAYIFHDISKFVSLLDTYTQSPISK